MCDKDQLRQTTRQLQLDYQQEKDRLTDYYTSKCQKEKQQTSQQLLQKFTLDLAEARESSIKQYRLERELYEHQLQLRCHKEKEDIRKDLTLKYHQEVENVRIELSREKERDLRELKNELLQNFYHYEQQIPSPISLISDVATDEKNDSAPSLSSQTLTFQEWKGKLFENEISDLTNAIRSQYAIEKQLLLTEQQSTPSLPNSLIPQHTNIWLEGNALIIGIISAIVRLFIYPRFVLTMYRSYLLYGSGFLQDRLKQKILMCHRLDLCRSLARSVMMQVRLETHKYSIISLICSV